MLLTRDKFREAVFARDDYKCVVCKDPAADAHHIIERRLWPDGGYYLDNGASVCEYCHLACESTQFSVEDIRLAAGITKIIVPPHLYPDQRYDKWGNPILINGTRLKGELYFDEGVQKILHTDAITSFAKWVKYPRTHHLPWSENIHNDDRVIESLDGFKGQKVVVTEKLDGENTTLYADYIHARSVDGRHHESRDWVKQFWSRIAHDIPEGWRICGENLYAKHSIHYKKLPTYFMGFSIWNEYNICISWDETLFWFELLGITPVPVIYQDIFDREAIKDLWEFSDWYEQEGYVVRVADSLSYGDFRHKVAKFVRHGHIQTVKHWMHGQAVERNLLEE